ncbi:MAG: hypothetical protein E6Q97_22895 [Desulfurellales bacterium]|nr:MAG: hypothetical protein E6Q97_22895 [Desulfurellales bacterium]
MTQQEHLQLIRAKCVQLLEQAKQRSSDYSAPSDLQRKDWDEKYPVYGGCIVINKSQYHGMKCQDATFIASAAGAFEAALASTVAAIDQAEWLVEIDSQGKISLQDHGTTHRMIREIIASWPTELLQP